MPGSLSPSPCSALRQLCFHALRCMLPRLFPSQPTSMQPARGSPGVLARRAPAFSPMFSLSHPHTAPRVPRAPVTEALQLFQHMWYLLCALGLCFTLTLVLGGGLEENKHSLARTRQVPAGARCHGPEDGESEQKGCLLPKGIGSATSNRSTTFRLLKNALQAHGFR